MDPRDGGVTSPNRRSDLRTGAVIGSTSDAHPLFSFFFSVSSVSLSFQSSLPRFFFLIFRRLPDLAYSSLTPRFERSIGPFGDQPL
jgi:hypothetical protein